MKKSGVNAYASVQLETGINSASPQKLISLLYQGLLDSIKKAIHCIENKDYEGKAKAIDKASRILTEGLKQSLDFEKGGDIAENLFDLYNFVGDELFRGSVKNEVTRLDLCVGILETLADAWNEAIGKPEAINVSPSAAQPSKALLEVARKVAEAEAQKKMDVAVVEFQGSVQAQF